MITIVAYTAALMLVIATSITGLKTANTALDKMYSEETAALRHLTASSEGLLQVRVDLGAYEALVTQGKSTDAVLARVHAELAGSDRELAAYAAQPPSNGVEMALANALRAKREQLMKQALAPEIAALDQKLFDERLDQSAAVGRIQPYITAPRMSQPVSLLIKPLGRSDDPLRKLAACWIDVDAAHGFAGGIDPVARRIPFIFAGAGICRVIGIIRSE